ncbi:MULTISPECIES: hypothetical protein [Streptomycetaceae]|uniref:Uncharacterized protein n=1 Tax=Streptantibioticus cattleyicolor (strain ATCC 35852 / DSM 46488 / JCM 4925 / NBRC 14057 / NRRL 8057) TaxID=1003195 RepID=F8JY44_STREN|nr:MULTISPECIES: hypothetical protein [Streptomycetaceae]AEW94620.1 hypothetical protein SCATT_22490 [Streptantibioticus cattleyicolor NRRL 8057 = DSM 46488]MYS59258.1 hypothetical protein [Streptomyces sp. SID5468]CCB74977.1 conserved membrane protein of unknown function [Streptantibioticus cattleyicolor NRRL 8057 = DSM 46488]
MSHTALTVGGLAVGLAITGVNAWSWWKSPGRDPKHLLPFASGFALGALSTICGGLLGAAAGWTAGLNNAAGGHIVPGATGTGAGTVARGAAGGLTPGGALLTFLLLVGVIVAWRAATKVLKRRLAGGWWAGATLTLSAGVAGLIGSTIVPVVNTGGDSVLAWFNGGAVL